VKAVYKNRALAPSEARLLVRRTIALRERRTSREAAKECSPRRKPWVNKQEVSEPRRGEREMGKKMRECFHQE